MTVSDIPKITFGIIVLNGEPFTKYCLRSIYPFAHEIIVVEGSVRSAAALARPDGHSKDGTLEALYQFKSEEDYQNKVQIITRRHFWSEKDEQSQAYATLATGDYLWQVDIDEFYKHDDMKAILAILKNDPEITTMSFKQITFWGGFDYITDGWYLRRGTEICHRLFKWRPGYSYVTHRPPTIYDLKGRDLRSQKWINGYKLAQRGIFLYHYSLLFPEQVVEKCTYYSHAKWANRSRNAIEWAENNFFKLRNPFRVHNVYQYPSWLERFEGEHPSEIARLRSEIKSGVLDIKLRQTDDIECLLSSKKYALKRLLFQLIEPFNLQWRPMKY